LATTTPILFFTRWITHFCAPVFLSGASAWFQSFRKNKKELCLFFIKRGLWLIFIEIVIMNFAYSFGPDYSLFTLQVIWAIGISMNLLGLSIWLPFAAIFIIGLLIVLGHNSLDFYEARRMRSYPLIYSLLHHPGFYPLWDRHRLLALYPFLSWTGLMILGYCFGKLFTSYEGVERRKILTWLGIGIIEFFIALRATNLYGNPEHWSYGRFISGSVQL
jgi:uncharacterized membrane protein